MITFSSILLKVKICLKNVHLNWPMRLGWLCVVPLRGLVTGCGPLWDCGFGALGPLGSCSGCVWWGGRQPVDGFLSHWYLSPSFSLSKSKSFILQKTITHIFVVVKVNMCQFGSKFI